MSEAVIFISHFHVKAGKLNAFSRLARDMAGQIEASKRHTAGYLIYRNSAGTEATIVHVFADAKAMDAHFEGADERSRSAYEFLVPAGWEIYGKPSVGALAGMNREAASAGVNLTVHQEPMGGFLRG